MRAIVTFLAFISFLTSHSQNNSVSLSATKITPDSILSENEDKVVQIVFGWQLFDQQTYNDLWQEYVTITDPVTKKKYQSALYIRNAQGKIEPYLDVKEKVRQGEALAISSATCSGFVISEDGFIATNKSGVAGWYAAYHFPASAFPGSLVSIKDGKRQITPNVVKPEDLDDWIPVNATMIGGRKIKAERAFGKTTFIDVVFAGKSIHLPAHLSLTSNNYDVAFIKCDVPEALPAIKINENFNDVNSGQPVVIVGYPSIKGDSATAFPKASMGVISRIIVTSPGKTFYSTSGDIFSVRLDPVDESYSGAPVFNEAGNMIGIYKQYTDEKGFVIAYAIPVKYAVTLVGPK